MVIHRGSHEEIDVLPGFPLENKLSGNVVDLCPVGALGDKDFLYQQRVWFMKKHDGVCAGCSTGCSIHVEENQDRVWRLKPRENPFVNQWWMCDEGRYGYHHVHDEGRLTSSRRRDGERFVDLDWSAVPAELNAALQKAGRLAALLSPHLTLEEAWLLATYIRRIDPTALLAIGPVPEHGEDERFANGFTIRAEKCPNRRGVEEVVRHFMHRTPASDDVAAAIEAGEVRGAWVSGGYKTNWIDETVAARFASLEVLVVQDLFESPLWKAATHQLPGGAFAEREGSYVNRAGRLQSFKLAVRPPAGVWVEGPLYWRLLERPGLYRARPVLDELAAEVLYFSAASGEIPPVGLDLRINQLAAREVSVV
jgi:NADH-quinone oxidoreductase subunit G